MNKSTTPFGGGAEVNMNQYLDIVVGVAALITALTTIAAAICFIVKWAKSPSRNSKEIKRLEDRHDADQKRTNDEFCVLSYAILAALDALKQQGYNGAVTEAREKIDKFLNQKAHGQKE